MSCAKLLVGVPVVEKRWRERKSHDWRMPELQADRGNGQGRGMILTLNPSKYPIPDRYDVSLVEVKSAYRQTQHSKGVYRNVR